MKFTITDEDADFIEVEPAEGQRIEVTIHESGRTSCVSLAHSQVRELVDGLRYSVTGTFDGHYR